MSEQPETKLVPMTREAYGDLGRANYSDRSGFEARWDEMAAVPDERPKGGHIQKVGLDPELVGVALPDAWDAARTGDGGAAVLAGLVKERERRASMLHRRMIDVRDELDRAARALESGRRSFVLSRSSWLEELPQDAEMLQLVQDAIHEAQQVARHAATVTPETASFRLAAAADALDALDAVSPEGDSLAHELRARGQAIYAAEQRRIERERQAREDAAAAEKAARIARPLGATERTILRAMDQGSMAVPNRTGSRDGKAYGSLVERGFVELFTDTDERARYRITDAGSEARRLI